MGQNEDFHALELTVDEDSQPVFETNLIPLRFGDDMLLGNRVRMSRHMNCRSLSIVELPAGFQSGKRYPDQDQLVIVHSGNLTLSNGKGETRSLGVGDVFKLTKATSSEHGLEVSGDQNATVIVVVLS